MGLLQILSGFAPGRRAAEPDTAAVLERMDALAAAGQRPEAIRHGAAHALRLDDLELWDRLSALRLTTAAEAQAQASPRAVWPPELPDPFSDAVLPEIDAADLDWRAMGGGVLHHGSLIVRNLVDAATAERLRRRIDDTLDAYDRFQAAGPAASRSSAYLPIQLADDHPLAGTRSWSRESGGVWAIEAPSVFEEVLEAYRSKGLVQAISEYLGEVPVLSVGKTVLRRAEPQGRDGFHQDGAFMGAGVRSVNVWLALSDCGVDAPGLELAPVRLPGIVETGTEGAGLPWVVGRPVAVRAAGEHGLVMPAFRAGDALVFDQLMLHSTGFLPGMTQRRYAVEAWFFAPSTAPRNQAPLAI